MKEILKKVSLSSLMFMMVFALGFGSFVPAASALSTGDLVKGPNSDAVYYVNGSTKHVFPDVKTYMTWYSNFDNVQSVTVAELDMLSTGAPVAYRPGTKLVTHPNTANVYAVEPGGVLRMIPDEATATALYGSNWSSWVQDVHELTFGQYTIGNPMTSSMHSEGTLLMKTGDTTIYYFDGSEIRPFADSAAFDANNMNFDYVVPVSDLSNYTVGSSITGAESFATIAGGGGTGTSVPTGTLSVSLSPNTAPANTVLLGAAARQGMVTLRVSTGANAVTIDSLTIERQGIASDAEFSSFDLIQSDTMLRLNKTSKSLNSTHQAVFNDDIMVPANTTWDIIVAANMAASLSLYAGEYPMIAVTSMTLKSATLSGTLPIVGNVMLTNGTVTAGTTRVAPGSTSIPSAATKEIGTKDYVVSSVRINNNSTESSHDMTVKQLTFTNNGSTAPEDVENIRLVNVNTGQTLATVAAPTDDAITFSNLNILVKKGDTLYLDLKLDVKGGSARTIQYDIDENSDLIIWDNLRNVYILPTYYTTSSYTTTDTASPYYSPNATTVGNGKLRIESVAIQDNKIAENKNGVLLGKFKFVMDGEKGNITSLGLKVTTSTQGTLTSALLVSDLTNLTVKDANGNVVAGPQDPAANQANNGFTATTTDTITVPVGETIYSVYGDLSADWTANDTIQIGIAPGAITIKGDVSGNTITPTPAALVNSTSMQIKSADLNVTLSGSPASQTVVAGSQDFTMANVVLDAADSGSDVRVTSFGVVLKTTGAQFPDNFSNIKLWVDGVEVPVDSTTTACSGASCSTAATRATTSLTISSGNLTIPKSQSKTVKVTGNIGTGATTGSLAVAAEGGMLTTIDSEAQTFTADVTNNEGNAMNINGGGTLNVAILSDPQAALAVGGTKVDVGKFTLEPKYEGVVVNSFGFTLNAPDGGINGTEANQVSSLELWEVGGSSAVGTITVSGANATITPSSGLTLTQNSNKSYVVKAVFENLGNDSSPAVSGAGVAVLMSNIDADGTAVGSSSVTVNGTGTAFKTFTPFRTLPTVSLVSFAGANTITIGDVDLMIIGVTANSAHDVGLGKFTFGVTTSSATLSPTGYKLYDSSSSSSGWTMVSNTNDCDAAQVGAAGTTNPKHIVQCYFDDDDNANSGAAAGFGESYIITAGTTKYFKLTGDFTAVSSTNDAASVSTILAGDASFGWTAASNMATIDALDQDDFIWSDFNFDQYSTSTATQTLGWFNGYRVPGLDNTSSTAQVVIN